MMIESETARDNAISFEAKKDGLTQRQSGDWQIRFTVSSVDMDQRLATAPMGTRFQAVLVEINDDETPRDREGEIRDKWRELGAVKQAGIRCKDPVFWAFLEERYHFPNVNNEPRAAGAVRNLCNVDSRRELDSNEIVRERWRSLDNSFYAWKVAEHA